MTIRDDIAAGTQAALAAISGGETWQWAARTGEPDADAPTFAADAPITNVQLARTETTEVYNERRGAWERIEVATIRVPSSVLMSLGDRVTDPQGRTWIITNAREGSGIGTWRYGLRREVGVLAGPDRGGGV